MRVTGTAPLIVHRFDQKAKQMMLEAQQTKTRAKKLAKDPVADFEASKYLLPDGRDGFPVVAFKAATVGAARMFDGISMVQLKSLLRFHGEGPDQLVPLILDGPPIMREDTVRVGMGTADLRYRAQYFPWSVDLVIEYPPSQISIESIVALVDAGGIGGANGAHPHPRALPVHTGHGASPNDERRTGRTSGSDPRGIGSVDSRCRGRRSSRPRPSAA